MAHVKPVSNEPGGSNVLFRFMMVIVVLAGAPGRREISFQGHPDVD